MIIPTLFEKTTLFESVLEFQPRVTFGNELFHMTIQIFRSFKYVQITYILCLITFKIYSITFKLHKI